MRLIWRGQVSLLARFNTEDALFFYGITWGERGLGIIVRKRGFYAS